MDFHTFCEQHMEVLEELSVDELRQQALMTEWERRQNEAKVKELQKNAMTSVTRLNKKIKEQRIKVNELEEKVNNLKSQMSMVEEVIEGHFDGGWIEFFEHIDHVGKELLRAEKWQPLIEYEDEDEDVMEVCAKSGAC
jgi:chromosome segregation ATPase